MNPPVRSRVPVARRELTRAHVAFYRAVIEGVDLRRAWEQYLQLDGDYTPALASATIGWLRQALIAQALSAGQAGLIGLFRRDPRRLKGASAPTLEQFASRYADAGDFSEAELLALWQEEHARDGRSSLEERRARLSRRLRDALQVLERTVRQAPRADDPVAQWLSPPLARRLSAAGLSQLGDVQRALSARRRQRWGAVRGVGPVWADRLAAWLAASGIGTAAPAEVRRPADALRPLECHPAYSAGAAAIERWLRSHAGSPQTQRSYRKAAERLLLWCEHERGIALTALTPADAIHYRQWLQDLGAWRPHEWSARGWKLAQAAWIGRKGTPRSDPAWRPFALGAGALREREALVLRGERPAPLLAAASIAQELQVLRVLFRHLRDAGHCQVDPWPPGSNAPVGRAALRVGERSLTLAQWQLVTARLEGVSGERGTRLRAAVWLSFCAGLRPAELLALQIGHLRQAGDRWQLAVAGRGGQERLVPLPSPAVDAVAAYLRCTGIDLSRPLDGAGSRSLLCGGRGRRRADGSQPRTTPLGYHTLQAELKRHFADCAERLAAQGDDAGAARLRRATAHWLRHSCATLGLQIGALDAASVRAVLGHRAAASTQAYVLAASPEGLADRLERLAAG